MNEPGHYRLTARRRSCCSCSRGHVGRSTLRKCELWRSESLLGGEAAGYMPVSPSKRAAPGLVWTGTGFGLDGKSSLALSEHWTLAFNRVKAGRAQSAGRLCPFKQQLLQARLPNEEKGAWIFEHCRVKAPLREPSFSSQSFSPSRLCIPCFNDPNQGPLRLLAEQWLPGHPRVWGAPQQKGDRPQRVGDEVRSR
ncbi:hypothetical protein BT67DRAFT_68744 [Trichocladium antarcticum]|uniref:Uncharacterized protein n=1 Tax=Trichocladium antarcticum TaxID=1450529 RepID=A0AAN6ZBJ7_9PEZI|nr:hypothetical protein BT67DRAFT_68744 [Trichocladium antarcticum]